MIANFTFKASKKRPPFQDWVKAGMPVVKPFDPVDIVVAASEQSEAVALIYADKNCTENYNIGDIRHVGINPEGVIGSIRIEAW
ncbi:hypothetical protein [Rheinheimera sp.]|uniref:hypothetical protein n=1 Tax=Rheinheimera sp. TaxID=1869214 RepID=UPI004048C381